MNITLPQPSTAAVEGQYVFTGSRYYLQASPAGAYHAVAGPSPSPERHLLVALLSQQTTTRPTLSVLQAWTRTASDQAALAVVYNAQERGWIEGLAGPRTVELGPLEPVATRAIAALSASGEALIADAEGFLVASHGFDDPAAERLAALSADIASLHDRHAAYLADTSGTSSGAWAIVDIAGNSRMGFWPMYIGANRFVLAVKGMPALHQPAFADLIWALSVRYRANGLPLPDLSKRKDMP